MAKSIAVFGGTFSPPGIHHRHIVESLAKCFSTVVVVPCGPRPDKPNDIDPVYRAAMADIAFKDIPNVEVDLFDLEQATFTRTHDLESRYKHRGEVWHVVGSDLLTGGRSKDAFVQRVWQHGHDLWKSLRYAVLPRPGHEIGNDDLPPQHKKIELNIDGSAYSIREKLFKRESIKGLVSPEIESYIERYGLYRGSIPSRATRWSLEDPRLLIVADERNAKAKEWAADFKKWECKERPNAILAIGGDGTMLHAIRKHWRQRVPFFGINAGHLGFLLNNAKDVLDGKFPPRHSVARQLPMLYCEVQKKDGSWVNGLAFNDAWIERATGQSAWLEVEVGGRMRLPKLVCDGALVATPGGSTAYARAMGAEPLLADTPGWLLVGSNVMSPAHWKSALLSWDAQVELRSLSTDKRPLNGYIDGVLMGEIRALRVRISRIATVELAYCAHHDMAEKIAQIQFPKATE